MIWNGVGTILAVFAALFGNISQIDIRNGIASGIGMARAGMVCGGAVLILHLISLITLIGWVTFKR
jgi:hypothetical protein